MFYIFHGKPLEKVQSVKNIQSKSEETMKKLSILVVVMLATVLSAAPKVQEDGAEKGAWTMDYEAAKAKAKETKTPLFVLFTGSDWCKWCKVMDDQVFSKPEWQEFAKANLFLAYIDFPQDEKLVPEKYKERNKKLQEEMDVDGYPTMILFDGEGKELERLQAEQSITAKKFVGMIRLRMLYTPSELEKVYAKLPKEEADALRKRGERKAFLEAELMKADKILEAEIEAAEKKHEAVAAPLNEELEKIGDSFDKEIIYQLIKRKSPEKLEEFKKAQAELEDAMQKAMEWIQTRPEQNEANNKIFMEHRNKIEALRDKTQGMVLDALP